MSTVLRPMYIKHVFDCVVTKSPSMIYGRLMQEFCLISSSFLPLCHASLMSSPYATCVSRCHRFSKAGAATGGPVPSQSTRKRTQPEPTQAQASTRGAETMTCKSRPSPQSEYAGRTHAMGATYVRKWLGFVVADHAQRRAQAADLVVPDHQCHAVPAVLFAFTWPCGGGTCPRARSSWRSCLRSTLQSAEESWKKRNSGDPPS